MFIAALDGTLLNADHIVSVGKKHDDRCRTVLVNGDVDYIDSWVAKALQTAPAHMVPAAVGTYVLIPVLDDPGTITQFVAQPVVAWALDAEGACNPITADGAVNGPAFQTILMHDGSVASPQNREWGSLADFLQDQPGSLEYAMKHPVLGDLPAGYDGSLKQA